MGIGIGGRKQRHGDNLGWFAKSNENGVFFSLRLCAIQSHSPPRVFTVSGFSFSFCDRADADADAERVRLFCFGSAMARHLLSAYTLLLFLQRLLPPISTLHDDLEKYWPSLSCASPSTCHGGKGSFWAHEWEKHGTCSFPVIRDEYNYFLTGLSVYFKYNVTQVLENAGYIPSNSEKYPLGGIVSAIENAFHATPLLVCSKGSVEELHLCFYKDFKPRDCVVGSRSLNDVVSSKSSCPLYVSLPAYVSLGLDSVKTTLSLDA